MGDEGVDEGAFEGGGNFTQFGQGDSSGYFGPFQLAHGGRGHLETVGQSSLAHSEGVPDGFDPAGMGTGPDGLKV